MPDSALDVFLMPRPVKITGRISTVTNSFVNAIIPVIVPTEREVVTVLDLLEMTAADLRCSYCDDLATEWDHLRPLVQRQRPTGTFLRFRIGRRGGVVVGVLEAP